MNKPEVISTKFYRIVDVDEYGNFKSLFHSVGKTRELPKGEWLIAKKKVVKDGSDGLAYLSGFHVLESLETMKKYAKRFKHKAHRRIISVVALGVTLKPRSKDKVYLADNLFIPFNCEVYPLWTF